MAIEAPDYRYNPFTGVFSAYGYGYGGNPVEVKTIPLTAPYWVYLDEIPRKDTPKTVSIAETSPGTTAFTEVSFTTTPAAGQFRVVYGAEPASTSGVIGQGIIEFNSADAGKSIDISYYGLGAILQNQFLNKMLAGDFGEAATIQGANIAANNQITSPVGGFGVRSVSYRFEKTDKEEDVYDYIAEYYGTSYYSGAFTSGTGLTLTRMYAAAGTWFNNTGSADYRTQQIVGMTYSATGAVIYTIYTGLLATGVGAVETHTITKDDPSTLPATMLLILPANQAPA